MGLPVPVAAQDPSGKKLGDGQGTQIVLDGYETISLWEKSVSPPSVKADQFIDTSTHRNVKWRTMHPRKLLTVGPVAGKCKYDPVLYQTIKNIMNVNLAVTLWFTTGASLAFFGALTEFSPDALEEGKDGEASYVITPTMMDPSDCSESDFVYTPGSGTAPC